MNLLETAKKLPQLPGVYLYKDSKGEVIYVGKAKNLRSRVSSYFMTSQNIGTKTQALISRIDSIEVIQTLSEIEALILEASLVKEYKPKYNILLKDDKSYLYIVIRKEILQISNKQVNIPKVLVVRKTDLQETDLSFGPYPDGNTAKYIVKTIRKIFPFRDCSINKFKRHQKMQKPCLYGHINLCDSLCLYNSNIKLYRKNISSIKKFLSGESKLLINEYTKKMQEASEENQYELAAYYRDLLKKFTYVTTSYKGVNRYIDNPNLIEDLGQMAMQDLKESIEIVDRLPKRIECYDISNISGKDAVGSMVVAINGLIQKNEYKRFKIKTTNTPDDFIMLHEVLERRLKREFFDNKIRKWGKPDLIVLDGGKGQVSKILGLLEEMNIYVPVIGLAKRYERVIYYKDGFHEISLPKNTEGQKLLIQLRDESHRFAQNYHHKIRSSIIKKQ